MSKKDRVAISISFVYLFLFVIVLIEGSAFEAVVSLFPLVIYWAYRFAKGNISFIQQ